MLLTVALLGPAGHEESAAIDAQGASLGYLLQQYAQAVELCSINGRIIAGWQNYVPQRNDRIRLSVAIREPVSITAAITATVTAITTAVTTSTVIQMIIAMAISMALGQVIKALTPSPKAPKLPAQGEAFGITGFANTTGQGTPIPVWYGQQRVWGHVIDSGAELSPDHSTMIARVLYCLGDSGGDEYEAVFDVLIDRIPSNQYKGVVTHTRLGSLTQTIIPDFSRTSNLFVDGRTLPYDDQGESGTTIPYTTHGNNINIIKLFLHFPGGLWRVPDSGTFRNDFVEILIELKSASDPDLTHFVTVPSTLGPYWIINDAVRSAFFREIWIQTSMLSWESANQYWADRPDVKAHEYYGTWPPAAFEHWYQLGQFEGSIWHDELASQDRWDLRITVVNAHTGSIGDAHATTVVLYNVQEESFTTTNYPGYVLLGVTGLQGNQVRNLQALEVSAFVVGKKVKNPLAPGAPTIYSRERPWIVRDILTHPTCGMGYEFSEAEIDDVQWYQDAVTYYDEMVPSQDGGTEFRDVCDVGITERRWDWDWIKRVAGEGRACVVPSGLKWKYIIDKPGTPNLLLAEPGNIIEGSISMEIAPPEDPFNQIVGQFRDSASFYTSELSQPIDSILPRTSILQKVVAYETITRESEVLRENMIQMKRQDLERRRFSFVSPSSQLLGEPFDLDWLSERTIGDIGAYTGILPAGCTTTTLNLPYAIDLDEDKAYLAIIQHKGMSACETRVLGIGAGHLSQVAVTTPFDAAPEEGAVFAIGEQSIDHIVTRARDFQIDDSGRITQIRTEYIEEVYNPDPLPPILNRKKFPLSLIPPIPIRAASAFSELVQRPDGSIGMVVKFDIAPGLAIHGNVMPVDAQTAAPLGPGITDVTTTIIFLAIGEPATNEQVNYYRGAYLLIIDGPYAGQERKILYYNAPARAAACEQFTGLPLTGTSYRIRWNEFSETAGFKLEQSTDRISWMELARPLGRHFEKDGGDQGGTYFYRFTPYSQNGIFNNFAALVLDSVTLSGDTTPPNAPEHVVAWVNGAFVTAQAEFTLPTSLDLAALEVELWRFDFLLDALGNPYRGNLIGWANARAGASYAGIGQSPFVRTMFDLSVSHPAFATDPPSPESNMYARVRSIDFTGNASAWVQSNDFIVYYP